MDPKVHREIEKLLIMIIELEKDHYANKSPLGKYGVCEIRRKRKHA